MRLDQARAYVEDLLEKMLNIEHVVADSDGDYPVLYRDAPYYVRVIMRRDALVQIFSTPVVDVEPTPALFEELNQINADVSFARAFWVGRQILIETEVLADSLDLDTFENSCSAVGSVSLSVGQGLQERHGGELRFIGRDDAPDAAPEGAPDADGQQSLGVGQYL